MNRYVWTTVFDWLPHVPAVLDIIVLVGAAVLAWVTIKKYIVKPIGSKFKKVDRAIDSVLGYPAIVDKGTGREIQPATPSMAERVKDLEDAHIRIANAMESMAKTQQEMLVVSQKVVDLSIRFDAHEQESHKWQQDHEAWTRNWIDEHNGLHSIVAHSSVNDPEEQ